MSEAEVNALCRGVSGKGPGTGTPGRSGPKDRSRSAKGDPPGGAKFDFTITPLYHQHPGNGAWYFDHDLKHLTFTNDSQGLRSVTYQFIEYQPANVSRTVFGYRENRIFKLTDGFRWENKDGDWELYDLDGFLRQTGQRNLLHAIFTYDANGHLATVDDATGRRLATCTYTGGLLTSVQDGSWRTVTYTWQNGQITNIRDQLGQDTRYEYDGQGRLSRTVEANGLVQNIRYDNGGYVYSILDDQGQGRFFAYNYDPNAHTYYASVRTTAGQIKETLYDSAGRVLERRNNGILDRAITRDSRTELQTAASGQITRRDFDEWGNVTREVRPDGGVTTWAYDPVFHQPGRTVDPRGAVTLMAYDANGNLTNRIEAAGTPIARTNAWLYNDLNQLVLRTDARGNAMAYTYDPAGNLVREYDPSNPSYQTLYAYDLRGNRTAVTNALGSATLYGFDALNRLVAETNALGYVTLYTYVSNQLAQVETGRDGANRGRLVRYRYDSAGRRTQTIRVDDQDQEHVGETTSYDGDGRVVAVANALGQTTRYEYNALGQRVRIIRPFSATETSDTRYEYDDAGRLVREIDPLGVITQTEYDAMGRERKATEALGTPVQRSRERGYDLAGNLTSLTYSDGTNAFTTLYAYDLPNRRTQIRGALEYPRDFEYDATGNLTAEINGRGYRTEYAYDQYSRRTNTVEGIGHGEPGEHAGSFEYDLLGRVVTSYDGNWNHRHYHHDALGRQTEQSIPLAPTNALPAGNWWTDNSVVLNRTWFNPWGQPVATSNMVGGVTATVFDALGRRFTHTDAAGLTLTNTYNEMDQLLVIGYPVVSTAPPGSPATSIRNAYDAYNAQMLASTTDRANLTTRYGYEKRFQRASEISSWGALTTYRTDELGRQTAVTNALNEVTQSVFDQFDQLVATIYPDHIPVTQERIEYRAYDEFGRMTNHWGAATYDVAYAYDLAGNQVSLTDGNGNTTRWEYDGRNRKVRKIYADNSDYEYGYDANGNQTHKRDAMQRTTRYEFNAYNLLVRADYPNDPDVTFGYDDAGRRVWMVDATGTNTWNCDAASRIVANAQLNAQHVVSYTLDAEGNRLAMTITSLPAGEMRTTDYSYDAAGRLVTIIDHGVSESPFRYVWSTNANHLASLDYPSGLRTSYAHDVLGRRNVLSTLDTSQVEITRFAYGHDRVGQRTNETTLTHTDQFAHDAKRQLVAARRFSFDGTPDPTWDFAYDYDPLGNRKTATEPDGVHRYTVNAVNQYWVITNGAGRLLNYDGNGNLLGDAENRYRFDDNDQLAEASNATTQVSFKYDGIGRCALEQDFHTSNRIRIVYDGVLTVTRLSDDDSQTSWVTRGLDFSLSRDRLGGIGGLLAISTAGDASHLVNDGRGNIRMAYRAGSAQVSLAEYGPFGHPAMANAGEQPFGFSSKEWLPELRLAYFGRRFCSLGLGRWLNRDPLAETGGENLYRFVRNNPLNNFDPDGRIDVKTIASTQADQKCGEKWALWLFTAQNSAGCHGWIVQRVTIAKQSAACPSQCSSPPSSISRCEGVLFEAWPVRGTDGTQHPEEVKEGYPPGLLDIKPYTNDKSGPVSTAGSGRYSARGEIRFVCASDTTLDPPERWGPVTVCNMQAWSGVTHEPVWWSKATGEAVGHRLNAVSWECCPPCKERASQTVTP